MRKACPGPAAILCSSSIERAAAVINGSRVLAKSRIRNTVAQGGHPSTGALPFGLHLACCLAAKRRPVQAFLAPPQGAGLPASAGTSWGRVFCSASDSLWLHEQSLIRLRDGPWTARWCSKWLCCLPDSSGL